ncbi:DEAD/DEAH box helicase family protein [Streptomyces albidoflavus]
MSGQARRREQVPEQLKAAARKSPNFGRLYAMQPLLAIYGAQAEQSVFTNPNVSYVASGQFGELLAAELVQRAGVRIEGTRQIDRLAGLQRAGLLPGRTRDAFDTLRRGRNDAAHNHLFDTSKALKAVELCFQLGQFFSRAIDNVREIAAFVPPQLPSEVPGGSAELAELREALGHYQRTLAESQTRLSQVGDRLEAERRGREEAERLTEAAERARAESEAEVARHRDEIERLRRAYQDRYDQARLKPRPVTVNAREAIVERAQKPEPLNEVQARVRIDEMLTQAGWTVQNYGDLNPLASQGVAVREFTLATGRADYVLYVDGMIVGVIEAKREGTALAGALAQNERYAGGVLKEHSMAVWREQEPFAFRYATTGAETFFLNRLDPHARSRQVFAFHRPESFAAWMKRATEHPDTPTFRAALRTALPVLESHDLRTAQEEAVVGLESSLAQDKPRALIQMATGAGKTYTAVTESYRLLKHARARRILFLVDRNNLGRQAKAEFDRYKAPDENRKFTDLYNVDSLGRSGLQETSSVVVSTIQRMYALLKGEPLEDTAEAEDREDSSTLDENYMTDRPVTVEYNPAVPIESFDLIVIDECHRSIYGLWRGVLDYFDAHLVGLTATPTRQTKGFFDGNMVSEYTYEQAVADGVNVDFDVVTMDSSIREDGGAKIEKGTTVRIRDRKTRAQRYEELDEDFTYTVGQIGRTVIAEDEIRAVLTAYKNNWQRWFPGRTELPKTLVFAASDDHADEVLKQVKEVFGRGDAFAKKITYRSRDKGDDPEQLVNDLRNSPLLRVAVTVDMIATGTDVKALECVIFLRAVRSPVLFEQMKGRGARTIDADDLKAVTPDPVADLAKDRFVLVDAVGVTASPLVDTRPMLPPDGGSLSLAKLMDKAGSRSLTAEQAETLGRRLARLDRKLTKEERERIEQASGGVPLADMVRKITDAVDVDTQDRAYREGGADHARRLVHDSVETLTTHPELRKLIIGIKQQHDLTYDATTEVTLKMDEVPREERAAKELAEWRQLLDSRKRDETAAEAVALQVILGSGSRVRPREARAHLKELMTAIKATKRNWTPKVIWDHYELVGEGAESLSQTAGLGDLMNLVRYTLGADDQLRPYRSVVEERFEGWLLRQRQAGAEFTDDQLWWLHRIKDAIVVDLGMEREDFGHMPFTEKGGGPGFVNAFGGRNQALELLDELNRELA